MARENFPAGVAEQLKYYVYRLIDPRNGETFYVGKGRGNRIFSHAKGDLSESENEDAADLKVRRIQEIKNSLLEVGHVVHRHGIESESVAYEVEAAVIDAYPGLTNKSAGHGSDDYGCRHVEEVVRDYAREPFEVKERLILISIGKTYDTFGAYEAVRCAWRIDVNKAGQHLLVLAHVQGLVVGAFRPKEWLEATLKNFPAGSLAGDTPGRWGFIGDPAEPVDWNQYVGKRVPDEYRPKGAASPVRYLEPKVPTA